MEWALEVVHSRPVLERPFHVRDEACQRKSLPRTGLQHLLDQGEHPVLIEVPVAQVRLVPGGNLELALRFSGLHCNPGLRQLSAVGLSRHRVYDMECLFAAIEPFAHERLEHTKLFVEAVKERADVAKAIKRSAGKADRQLGWGLHHRAHSSEE